MTGIIDEQLRVLEQLKDIYADSTILEREGDDASPFYLVQSMARTGAVRVVPSSTTVDGGNLIRLPDGVCLTTSDLIPANGEGGDLDSVLGSTYGCKDVVYLRPLPGDSIKHVDMFLLPADDGHLLLASYDPRKESVGQFWHDAVPEVRRLTMEASYAMNANARLLAKRGYSVRRVVAPLPRSEPGSGFYFPTNLNALVRVSPEGQRVHVLVPTYENYEDSLQREAVRTIEKSFPGAKISTVEATAAARLQGAVHCLSLVFPYKTTVFADASSRADWKALNQLEVKAAERERRKSLLAPLLDRGVDRRGAPAETLQDGVWTNEDDVMIKFFPDGQALVFLGEGVMQISYSLNDDGSKLELVRGEDQHQEFSVEWPEADKLVLTDVDEDVSMALTRVRD
ncbi:MAG: agmatine deiminase family protein [Polyangiaceae bacterium]